MTSTQPQDLLAQRDEMSREDRIKKAIDDFNAQGLVETYYDRVVPVRARKPILATDCDYEIVRISGVEGRRLTT